MKQRIWLLHLLVCLPLAHADLVYFSDGSVREGKVVNQTAKKVEVEYVTPAGSMRVVYPAGKITRIELKKTAIELLMEEYRKRLAATKPDDAKAWLALGTWCSEHAMLKPQARLAFEHAIAIEPDNELARDGLGFVRFRGIWVTKAEAMGAQGFVEYNRRWLTAEAFKETIEAEAARTAADFVEREFAAREKELLAQLAAEKARADEAEQRFDETNYYLRDLVGRIERLERSRPRTIIIRDIYPRRPDWWVRLHKTTQTGTKTSKKTNAKDVKPAGPMKKKITPTAEDK